MADSTTSVRLNGAAGKTAPPPVEKPSLIGRLVLRGKRIASQKSVKHLIAAITRYGDRLGSQFAGAMTYFSFLSLVPILMVGFAIGGIVLQQQPGSARRAGGSGRSSCCRPELAEPITALDRQRRRQPAGGRHRRSADRPVLRASAGWATSARRPGDLAAGVRGGQVDGRQLRRRHRQGSRVAGRPRGGHRGLVGAEHLRRPVRHPAAGLARARRPALARPGDHHHHPADRDGRRRVDLHVGLHDAARQGTALPVQGAAARVDPGRDRLRDPQVRADHAAARMRPAASKTAADLRPGHRSAVLLQPGRAAGAVRRGLDRDGRGRPGAR